MEWDSNPELHHLAENVVHGPDQVVTDAVGVVAVVCHDLPLTEVAEFLKSRKKCLTSLQSNNYKNSMRIY